MPQIQMLEGVPGFGGQLGKALGTGLGTGLSAGISQGLQNQLKEFQQIKKNRSALSGAFGSYSKQFGFDKSINESTRRNLLKEAEGLIDQGQDPLSAINSVYDKYLSQQEKESASSQGGKPPESKFDLAKALTGGVNAIPGIKEFLSQRESPEGPTRLQSLVSAPVKGAAQFGESVRNVANPVGQILEAITGRESNDFSNILPTQDKPAERLLETVGRTAPAALLTGGASPLVLGEIASAAGFREFAKQLGAGENVQTLAEMFGFSLPSLGKLAFSKLGKIFKAKGALPPPIKEIGFKPKAGEGIPSPIQAAEEAMDSYTKAVNQSVKNLADRGITVEQINSGDPIAIKELQKEASKVVDLYKEADKMNLKEFHKQHADIAKKLPESPLEKYYSAEKEIAIRPETAAKKELINKPLENIVKQNQRRAKDLQYQILSADQELRSGKLIHQEIERIQATRSANSLAHQQAMNEIKNANFEMKYGRAPATSEQIQTQIDKTFDELRAGIKDPSSKKVEAFRKGFEKDKHLIDQANKLIARGEIPGPKVFDEYTKIHEQYLKSYDDLINELTSFIKESKGKPRFAAKVQRAEELSDLIKNTRKLGEAKLEIQKDKRRIQHVLNKPSGAFFKNMLRDTRKDIDAFQKDYFKWSKIAEGPEKKAAEIAKKTIKAPPEVAKKEFKRETLSPKEPPKAPKKFSKTDIKDGIEAGEKAAKNPTEANVKNASERAGMTKEDYKDYIDKVSDKMKKSAEKIKSGNASPQDEISILKDILSRFKKLPKLIQIGAGGVIVGTTQALSEEYLGYKPPIVAIGTAAGALGAEGKGLVRGAGIGYVGNIVYKYLRDGFNDAAANQLKSKRGNPKEFDAYYKKLREKYGDTRAAKIRKSAI